MLRSTSEPPEVSDASAASGETVNQKTGLRGGFPIRINGLALGSQENLSSGGGGRGSAMDLFGPRVGSSRQVGDKNGRTDKWELKSSLFILKVGNEACRLGVAVHQPSHTQSVNKDVLLLQHGPSSA